MAVICLGEALIDLLANQLDTPVEQVTDWTPRAGGAPTNVACGLVKLGTPTALISCLGCDDVGTNLTELLTKIGVDRTGLQYHPTAPTRQIYVTRKSPDGDRSFAGFINNLASDRFADTFLTADRIPESLFSQAKYLAIGTISLATPISAEATDRALTLARQYQLQVLVDVNWRSMFWDDINRAKAVILEVLNRANFIKMAKEEAEWLFDLPKSLPLSAIDLPFIHQQLPNARGIFLTDGSAGCKYSIDRLAGFVPAFKVASIDTTGAGDSFVAACLHQLCRIDENEISDPQTAVNMIKYAAAAGALTTLKPGAIDAQPTHDEVMNFLSTYHQYTIGVDYGTLSGRAVVVRVSDGAELGSAVFNYPHKVMDRTLNSSGATLPPEWALQDPNDYLEVLKQGVPEAVQNSGVNPLDIIGIGIDFTACTVLPVQKDGTPLCFLPSYRDNPHAYVKLWKHHAAQPHADRINQLARDRSETWLPRYGGKISSEWMLAKALQILEEAPEIYSAADRIIEAGDWVVWQLAGVETCNTCMAGYKANFQSGRYPSSEFLGGLNPGFANFATEKLISNLDPLGGRVGGLTDRAAAWTGLPAGIAVAVANVDAHVALAAANALQPGQMVLSMGTSTCHIMNSEILAEVPGMCGVVDGGVTPGMFGYEAGQSGVGDIFGWFVENCVPSKYYDEARSVDLDIHAYLTSLAATQSPGAHGLIALDWWNGNRSVLVDAELSGTIVGMTLATRSPDIYRALIEATAFGTRIIIEAFETAGVPVNELVIAGGLTKNKMLMQIYADVTRRNLSIVPSSQGPALGSAIHAAVAAGAYPNIYAAAVRMGNSIQAAYQPNEVHSLIYDELFAEYKTLHDYFGRGENDVMRRL